MFLCLVRCFVFYEASLAFKKTFLGMDILTFLMVFPELKSLADQLQNEALSSDFIYVTGWHFVSFSCLNRVSCDQAKYVTGYCNFLNSVSFFPLHVYVLTYVFQILHHKIYIFFHFTCHGTFNNTTLISYCHWGVCVTQQNRIGFRNRSLWLLDMMAKFQFSRGKMVYSVSGSWNLIG